MCVCALLYVCSCVCATMIARASMSARARAFEWMSARACVYIRARARVSARYYLECDMKSRGPLEAWPTSCDMRARAHIRAQVRLYRPKGSPDIALSFVFISFRSDKWLMNSIKKCKTIWRKNPQPTPPCGLLNAVASPACSCSPAFSHP